MKHYKVDVDTYKETEYNNNIKAKQKHGADAVRYCKRFITIPDLKAFFEDMSTYFIAQWKLQYENAWPKMVTVEKQFEMSDFQLHKLMSLKIAFDNIKVELDENLEPINTPDFNIYLNSEGQIKTYKEKEALLKAINTFEKQGHKIYNAKLIQAIEGYRYDFALNELKPTY